MSFVRMAINRLRLYMRQCNDKAIANARANRSNQTSHHGLRGVAGQQAKGKTASMNA